MGEREISEEGGDVRDCWGEGAREVRWAWRKIMWKSSRDSGMRTRDMAVFTIFQMLAVACPSSILG